MADKKKVLTESAPDEFVEIDSVVQEEFEEDICKVLWIKKNAFGIDFQGCGISIHVSENHILDNEKIGEFIKVRYKSSIGKSDFQVFPIYK